MRATSAESVRCTYATCANITKSPTSRCYLHEGAAQSSSLPPQGVPGSPVPATRGLGSSSLRPEPIDEDNPEEGAGRVFENRYAAIDMVPSRYGPFTTFRSGNGGGAAVLAVRDGKVMMVRQPRYATGQYMWELPRGGNREGESNFDAGVREASEETGVSVDPERMEGMGSVHPDTGVVTTEAGLFLARLPSPPETPDQEPDAVAADEVDDVRWVPADELVEACVDGTITDSFTCIAVMRARLKGLI